MGPPASTLAVGTLLGHSVWDTLGAHTEEVSEVAGPCAYSMGTLATAVLRHLGHFAPRVAPHKG